MGWLLGLGGLGLYFSLGYLFPPMLIIGAIIFIHLLLIWTAANSS